MPGSRRALVAPQNTFLENLLRRTSSQHLSFVLANSRVVEWPIVFTNESFCKLVGFGRTEIMMKSALCPFLQGARTDPRALQRLQTACEQQLKDQIELLFYKKNKSPIWLLVEVAPIADANEQLVFMLLTFRDITAVKVPIEEDSKGLSKFARLARSITRNRALLSAGSPLSVGASPSPAASVSLPSSAFDKSLGAGAGLAGTPTGSAPTPIALSKPAEIAASAVCQVPVVAPASLFENLPVYKHEPPQTPPFIILHYCAFKSLWDWLILLLTIYTSVMVPFNVAFQHKSTGDYGLLVLDSLVDIVFSVDIILNFHTTFVGPNREVVADAAIIRRRYLRTWFVIDLLSCIPYDGISAIMGSEEQMRANVFSALKVLRLLRLGRVARKLDHYLEYGGAVLLLLICLFMIVAHWMSCVWFWLGEWETYSRGITYGWIPTLGNHTETPVHFILRLPAAAAAAAAANLTGSSASSGSNTSTAERPMAEALQHGDKAWGGPDKRMSYLTAMYFTLSCMTSVGFGNVSANTEFEKIFVIVLMTLGALMYASIFGNVTTIFQQMYSSRARYHEVLNNVREFSRLHNIPKELKERVLDYVVSTWSITKGVDSVKVLNYCPKDMRADICVHLNRRIFNEHAAFRLASEGCLRALAIHFTMSHIAPGDMVFRQGESVDSLCFVVSGSLEVVQDEEITAILSKGDVFGDAFWKHGNLCQATASVRALTYCDLHVIKREKLLEVLDFYRAFANSFARNLVLTINLRERVNFKKIADLQQEQELNASGARRHSKGVDTATLLADLPHEHPVKKLLARFKRVSNERGEPSSGSSIAASPGGGLTLRVPSLTVCSATGSANNSKCDSPKTGLAHDSEGVDIVVHVGVAGGLMPDPLNPPAAHSPTVVGLPPATAVAMKALPVRTASMKSGRGSLQLQTLQPSSTQEATASIDLLVPRFQRQTAILDEEEPSCGTPKRKLTIPVPAIQKEPLNESTMSGFERLMQRLDVSMAGGTQAGATPPKFQPPLFNGDTFAGAARLPMAQSAESGSSRTKLVQFESNTWKAAAASSNRTLRTSSEDTEAGEESEPREQLVSSTQIEILKMVKGICAQISDLKYEMRVDLVDLEKRMARTEQQLEVLKELLVYSAIRQDSSVAGGDTTVANGEMLQVPLPSSQSAISQAAADLEDEAPSWTAADADETEFENATSVAERQSLTSSIAFSISPASATQPQPAPQSASFLMPFPPAPPAHYIKGGRQSSGSPLVVRPPLETNAEDEPQAEEEENPYYSVVAVAPASGDSAQIAARLRNRVRGQPAVLEVGRGNIGGMRHVSATADAELSNPLLHDGQPPPVPRHLNNGPLLLPESTSKSQSRPPGLGGSFRTSTPCAALANSELTPDSLS